MNIHKNARLTVSRRLELVMDVIERKLTLSCAALAHGVSAPTARKWLGRYLAGGKAALRDKSSRPARSPNAIAESTALAIVELRRRRLIQSRIAVSIGVSSSTVGRVLRRAGLSHLRDLEPVEPVLRYEHRRPGDLLHIDIKKLGRIEGVGHRITGNRRNTTRGAGWEFLFVGVDDHSRLGFSQLLPDERQGSAVSFLHQALAYYRRLGIKLRRVLTDNGSAFRSKDFARACARLRLKHSFTKPYTPRTNGKAERFIQSALREWAYGIVYHHSQERAAMLERWMHHYNWHRPHQGINGQAPISRLRQSRNNVLALHS